MEIQVAKYKIDLAWKSFNVNVKEFSDAVLAAHPDCKGAQSCATLEIWFLEKPAQETEDAIKAMWDAIDSDQHSMALSYKPMSQIIAEEQADKAAKKASAKAKLLALGLSEAEADAIIG